MDVHTPQLFSCFVRLVINVNVGLRVHNDPLVRCNYDCDNDDSLITLVLLRHCCLLYGDGLARERIDLINEGAGVGNR